jgi:hypothetical protein
LVIGGLALGLALLLGGFMATIACPN